MGWQALFELQENAVAPANERTLARYRPTLRPVQVGALTALVVTPSASIHPRARIVYLHGGAYTVFSAHSTLFASVPLAHELGMELWSIDYPSAPRSRYDRTVPLAQDAVRAACADGVPVLLVGDSAGGGLALAVARRLSEERAAGPRALALWSPWADPGASLASRTALAGFDPVLRSAMDLELCALAYAPRERLCDPDVSPLRAAYSAAFPPTLIQCGSRDTRLREAVGLHSRLAAAGVRPILELVPGMVHSFPAVLPDLPESRAARRRMASFFSRLV